ncbi:hypothetical protein AVEN_200669-1 [Araneus ventricosus]|uniref:CCHC-type domain-containing protein n=1 Tax=Araneus ventricosus TaxID=182803 RepID=A0A4Y2L7M3_ARAVE|nr:hypothetical protein AVEN_200669-1 [Araneus ventricosus]
MGSKKKSRQDSASSTELDRVARYVRFLIISACDKEKGLCLSPFAVQKELKSIGDDPKTVKKLKSGDLLIETFSAIQTKSFLLAKTLANIPITVEPHRSLNSCRGVISEIQLQNTPENEILEGLSDQNVIHVRRIILRKRSDIISTKHLILTFSGTNLPDSIKAGYLRCKVRPYIPSPLRCFKCQKFGHSKASCRGKQTCVHCSSLDHSDVNCILEPKCSNCHQPHPSNSRSCPQWQIEKKIQQTKTERNISYTEAKKLLGLQSHPTYAQITKSLISAAETQTDEKLTNVHVPPLTLLKASNPKQQCSKMTFGTGSNDLSNFTTGKKKKSNKPSTSVTVTENKTNSVVASKFWKTSPLQVSNPVSVQVSNSPKSKANADGVTVDNRTLPSATTTEPMTTDNVSIHSSDNETESDNAIEYNPHETIDRHERLPLLSGNPLF